MVISIIFNITVLSFIFRVFNKKRSNNGKHINPPQAKGAWPIIGHLHLLGGSQLPHKVLATLAETYGPIFTIKLGFRLALVVSEPEMAKVCLTTNDKDFADRPTSVLPQIMGYNYGMFSFASYGDIETMSMKDIYESWVKNKEKENLDMVKMDMKHWFGNLILPDDEEGVRFQAVTRRFFELLGVFVVSDLIPIFKGLDIGGYKKAMKYASEEDFPGFDHDTIIKSSCFGLLTAGLCWTFVMSRSQTKERKPAKDGRIDIQTKNTGYGGNGNMYVGRQNRNQAFNAGNGLTQYDESNQIVQHVPRTESNPGKAMKDEAVSNLKDEENDFMLDDSFGDETLEELTVAVIMMARIQLADNNAVTEPNYDAVSEVNASHKVHEQENHVK
ncbi:cytochrome P450 CYP82D47-like protein [Tanacetum coccineum]